MITTHQVEQRDALPIGMIGALSRVLDLPPVMALKEANPKLSETWVKINGILVYLVNIDKYGFSQVQVPIKGGMDEQVISEKLVGSLEVFLPASGVYKTRDGGVVMLTKNPQRQWKRSFNWGIYNYKLLIGGKETIKIENVIEESRTDLWISKDRLIYFYNICVGKISKDNTVVCTNNLYEQELLDWIKYGHAIKALTDINLQTPLKV